MKKPLDRLVSEQFSQSMPAVSSEAPTLVLVHVCQSCGKVSRPEERGGTPDAMGVYHCDSCGHDGPLQDELIESTDRRLR